MPFLCSIILHIDSLCLLSETVLQKAHFSAGLFGCKSFAAVVGREMELSFVFSWRHKAEENYCGQTPFGLLSSPMPGLRHGNTTSLCITKTVSYAQC